MNNILFNWRYIGTVKKLKKKKNQGYDYFFLKKK